MSQTSYNGSSQVVCQARRLNSADFASPPTACTQGTDTRDRITRKEYDAYGRLDTVTDGLGTPLSYTAQTTGYHASGSGKGKVATVADGNGNLTSYAYDGFGRTYRVYYPEASSPGSSPSDYEEFTYDPNGNRTGGRLRDATSVSITYDGLNRMIVDLEGGTYDYDNLNRVTSMTKFSRTTDLTYDVFDNLKSEETAGLGTVLYDYDLAGRRTQMTWPDSVYVTYDWDDASNLTAIKLSGSTSLAAFGYDSLGRRLSLTRGNGTSTSYTYDDRSALTGFGLDLASTGNDQTVTLTRDAFGRITVQSGTNNAYDATPPAAWTGPTDYVPNGLNQIDTAGGATYGYDGRGNNTSTGTKTFTYDTGNRMTGMNSGAVALAYDAPGRLYEHAGASTTRFQYDQADLITEYNTSGTVLRRYVHGPNDDEPLVWFEGTGTSTPHYLMADERGSIVAVSDGSGAAEAINTYDEYGAPSTTSAAYASRFRYTGQLWFSDLGLYYYKARMYDPATGRFMQADPIGYGDGLNMYAYVGNDPVNGVDPTGMGCTVTWVGGTFYSGTPGEDDDCDNPNAPPCPENVSSPEQLKHCKDVAPELVFTPCADNDPRQKCKDKSALDKFLEWANGVNRECPEYMNAEMCEVDQARRVASVSSDKDLGKLIVTEAQVVLSVTPVGPTAFVFKTGHYAPRLAKLGVDAQKAEAAAMRAIINSGKLKGTVFVDGQELLYRGFVLPNGKINVGTIHAPW